MVHSKANSLVVISTVCSSFKQLTYSLSSSQESQHFSGFFCAVQSYVATERVEKKIGPDELMRIAKPITVATAKAVAAGNSGRQDDVIAAANMGRKAIFDLLHACKVSTIYRTTSIVSFLPFIHLFCHKTNTTVVVLHCSFKLTNCLNNLLTTHLSKCSKYNLFVYNAVCTIVYIKSKEKYIIEFKKEWSWSTLYYYYVISK